MDFISRLEGFPDVLEKIFVNLDIATISETEKVSTTWMRLITSLDIWKCVWKTNMRRVQRWKTLSVRMEHVQPQLAERLNKGSASSYREACLFVDGNFQQISQSVERNVTLRALKNEDEDEYANSHRLVTSDFRINDVYAFVGLNSSLRIFNRWTKQLVKEINTYVSVEEMQLNERFFVVLLGSVQLSGFRIEVYDVQELVLIQAFTIEKNDRKSHMKLGLGSDVLVFTTEFKEIDLGFKESGHLMIHVHRWNPSAAQFVSESETKLEVGTFDYQLYVHGKYLIFDFYFNVDIQFDMNMKIQLPINMDTKNQILVYSLETMELVRERQFINLRMGAIQKEYFDGGIVVKVCNADGQPCVAFWDVILDTLQPIAEHPEQFVRSFAMAHHPFQIAVFEPNEKQIKLSLIQRGQLTGNPVIPMPSECTFFHRRPFHPYQFYYDGVQMFARSLHEIRVADLVG